jgi:tetratricopeptide (TPR) repeat protein
MRLRGTAEPGAQRAAYRAAVAAFARLPAQASERAAALPAAAFCALQAGAPAQAARWIEESAARGGETAQHAEILVQALALAGDARGAVAAAHAAAAHEDAVVRAFAAVQAQAGGALCEAADVALREGRTDEGLFTFTSMVAATDRHPLALGNLALALRQIGRTDEAETTYRQALQLAPNDPELWNDLGLLFKGLGRDAEAVAAFVHSRSLETVDPPSGPATSNLVAMMRAGRVPNGEAPLADPTAALAGVLARFPEAGMARRLLLEELLGRCRAAAPFPGGHTDSRDPGR